MASISKNDLLKHIAEPWVFNVSKTKEALCDYVKNKCDKETYQRLAPNIERIRANAILPFVDAVTRKGNGILNWSDVYKLAQYDYEKEAHAVADAFISAVQPEIKNYLAEKDSVIVEEEEIER